MEQDTNSLLRMAVERVEGQRMRVARKYAGQIFLRPVTFEENSYTVVARRVAEDTVTAVVSSAEHTVPSTLFML